MVLRSLDHVHRLKPFNPERAFVQLSPRQLLLKVFNSQDSLPALCSVLCLFWSDLLPTEALSFYFHDQNVGTKRESHPIAYNQKKMPQVRKNLEKTLFIHGDLKILGIEQRWSISQVSLQLEKGL